MNAPAAGPARGAYSECVRRRFARPVHAGDVTAGSGTAVAATAFEGGAGARILLTGVTDGDRLSELRFRVFGCPHLIAAAEAVCERFEGEPVEILKQFDAAGLMAEFAVPIGKTGRILLLEDVLRSLLSQIERVRNEGN